MKPIKITEEIRRVTIAEIEKLLSDMKLANGKLTYSKEWVWSVEDDQKALVHIESLAWNKMWLLINSFNYEVAWHGIACKVSPEKYIIKDIIVYPQTVTGATVSTDQNEYEKWLMSLDDDEFNNLRFQGHSHVNMDVSPSSVDLSHQESILSQLGDKDFYIFAIFNKKGEFDMKIYDMEENTLYEKKDIVLEYDMKDFLANAKKLVNISKTYYGGYCGNRLKNSKKKQGEEEKSKQGSITSKKDEYNFWYY